MPLAGPVFTSLLMQQFSSVGFKGSKLMQMCAAIGNGVANYLLSSAIYQGTGVGIIVGAGVGIGRVNGIVGPVVGTNIMSMMTSMGFKGTKISQLSMAIGNAFANFIKMGIITSTCTGMAVGTGVGKLIVVGPVMGTNIASMFASVGFKGAKIQQFAMAIGIGICNSITSTGIVQTTIVGGGYPPSPSSGADIGKII